MSSQIPRIPLARSLVARFAVLWAGLIALAVGAFGYFLYHGASENLTDALRGSLQHGADGAAIKFRAWARTLHEDARFLSNAPVVREFVARRGEDDEARWRALAEGEFGALLAGKPNYFQIRLLDLQSDGRELLRLERTGGVVRITPEALLQEKGKRDYVQEAEVWLARNKGGVYLSEINLNQEFGTISKPHTPTLRAVARLEGSPHILAVINSDLNPLFEQLSNEIAPGAELRATGERGDYIAHPNPALTFGADLGGDARLALDYPDLAALPPGNAAWLTAREKDGELTYGLRTLISESPPRPVTLVASLPPTEWMPQLAALRRRALGAAMAAALLGAAAVFALSRPMVNRLRRLSAAIQSYDAASPSPLDLPTDRPDELGVVAMRFRELDTKVRAQVASLEAAHREAVAATEAKEEFLAVMSHEIRTPMNAVIGMIRALETNRPAEHQAPMLKTLRVSASNLLALVNSALDYTKLRAGQLAFEERDFDPAAAVREVAQAHAPLALEKGLKLEVNLADSLPSTVRGDPVRFRQILHNLVSNAVKFCARGTVTASGEPGQGRNLVFTVSDTGPGIAPDDHQRVFEAFEQVGQRRADEPGAGLGLSIAKALTDRQGGHLTLQSTPGVGSSFSVELPFGQPADTDGTALSSRASAKGALNGAKLLYVEDVESNRAVLTASLEGSGAEITFADDGASAIAAVDAGRFDCALIDLKLPDMDGDELATLLRVRRPTLPLVAVTAQAGEAVKNRCAAAGIAGFVLKPYEPETLREEILRKVADPLPEPGDKQKLRELFPEPDRRAHHAKLIATELQAAAAEVGHGDPKRIRHRLTTAIAQLGLPELGTDLGRLAHDDAPWLRQRCETRLRHAAAAASAVS